VTAARTRSRPLRVCITRAVSQKSGSKWRRLYHIIVVNCNSSVFAASSREDIAT
jgi:hypothetical protein